MEPHIHFTMEDVKSWIDTELFRLHGRMEEMRVGLKNVTGYRWDIQHFWVTSGQGKPMLQLMFWPGYINAWDVGGHVVALEGQSEMVVSKLLVECVRRSIYAIELGLTQCSQCKKWVKDYKPFCFAGAACLNCFDPKRHKGPDTRGD